MKINSILTLEKKLANYQTVIFDLDDTIFPQKNYDNPALKKVSQYLSKKLKKNKRKLFNILRKKKSIRRGKPPIKIFDFLISNFIKNSLIKKKIIQKSVNTFQKYQCKELKKSKSLRKLLKKIYKKKNLFLVTNGNNFRQRNKIKYLGIKSFFKKIYILDGVKKKLKPSLHSVRSLIWFLRNNRGKSVFVGDNIDSDKKFAKNLKISFIHFEI